MHYKFVLTALQYVRLLNQLLTILILSGPKYTQMLRMNNFLSFILKYLMTFQKLLIHPWNAFSATATLEDIIHPLEVKLIVFSVDKVLVVFYGENNLESSKKKSK